MTIVTTTTTHIAPDGSIEKIIEKKERFPDGTVRLVSRTVETRDPEDSDASSSVSSHDAHHRHQQQRRPVHDRTRTSPRNSSPQQHQQIHQSNRRRQRIRAPSHQHVVPAAPQNTPPPPVYEHPAPWLIRRGNQDDGPSSLRRNPAPARAQSGPRHRFRSPRDPSVLILQPHQDETDDAEDGVQPTPNFSSRPRHQQFRSTPRDPSVLVMQPQQDETDDDDDEEEEIVTDQQPQTETFVHPTPNFSSHHQPIRHETEPIIEEQSADELPAEDEDTAAAAASLLSQHSIDPETGIANSNECDDSSNDDAETKYSTDDAKLQQSYLETTGIDGESPADKQEEEFTIPPSAGIDGDTSADKQEEEEDEFTIPPPPGPAVYSVSFVQRVPAAEAVLVSSLDDGHSSSIINSVPLYRLDDHNTNELGPARPLSSQESTYNRTLKASSSSALPSLEARNAPGNHKRPTSRRSGPVDPPEFHTSANQTLPATTSSSNRQKNAAQQDTQPSSPPSSSTKRTSTTRRRLGYEQASI